MSKRIKTGIPGLDLLIGGGLIENRAIIIQGDAGTGKTTLGLQFLLNGVQKYSEPGILVSMEYEVNDVVADVASFGWDVDELMQQGLLRIVTPPGGFENPEDLTVDEVINFIFTQVTAINAKRLVIDSLNSLEISLKSLDRRELLRFITLIRDLNCTTLLISEKTSGLQQGTHSYLAHGAIELYNLRQGSSRLRAIEIIKMRGTEHSNLIHSMQISKGKGIEVLPHEVDIDINFKFAT